MSCACPFTESSTIEAPRELKCTDGGCYSTGVNATLNWSVRGWSTLIRSGAAIAAINDGELGDLFDRWQGCYFGMNGLLRRRLDPALFPRRLHLTHGMGVTKAEQHLIWMSRRRQK
jgi:hypothetical protein